MCVESTEPVEVILEAEQLGVKSCFMHPDIPHIIINNKLRSSKFLKFIWTITQLSSVMFQAEFCFYYLFIDNVLQNCQCEEMFEGYSAKTNYKEKN